VTIYNNFVMKRFFQKCALAWLSRTFIWKSALYIALASVYRVFFS